MSTPAIGQLATVVSRDSELLLLQLQLTATQSTHQYLGNGRFGLSKSHNGSQGGNNFTTFPRRRQLQRPLMTVWWDRGLLDEGQVQQTRRLLSGITCQWDFNAFHLDRLTGGHNLAFLCIHLFQENGLIRYYGFDPLVVWKFFALVEKSYHATNPYHNAVHAADVTQAMSRFLAEPALRNHLEPPEILASIIAAVCHDLDHPGLNEKFLIATSSHLAGLYNNTSVLENHHWSMAVALMHESGLSSSLSSVQHQELVEIIRSLILATDISRQQEFLTQLRYLLDKEELDLAQARCRHFMLQIALKCADISNPCRSWDISRLWSYRACEEFFRQGDKERELNIPVTPFCDRQNISVAKVQSTFYRYVASPLFEEWHRFLGSPLSTIMTRNLTSNQARWDLLVQQEGPSPMAESVMSQTSTSSSSGGGSLHCDPPRDNFPPSPNRRFSRSSADDDDSDPCTSYPYLPLDGSPDSLLARRHSLPFTITFYDEDMFLLGSHLHRQFSLGERRNRQAELLAATAQYRAAHRRRVFANRVAPQATVYDSPSIGCSFSSSMDDPTTDSNGESHRVTFRIGSESSPSLSSNHQNSNSRKEQFLSCRQDSCSASVCSCSISGGSCCTSGSSCCTSGPSCRRRQQSSSMDSDFGIRTHDCDPQFQTKTSVDEFVAGRFRDHLTSLSKTRSSFVSSDIPRVSFQIGRNGLDGRLHVDDDDDGAKNEKENFNSNAGRRRGSAPSYLLLNQINRAAAKLASTASAVVESVSRESSPNHATCNGLDWSHRRGSLPANLVQTQSCSLPASVDLIKKRKQKNKNNNNNKIIITAGDLLCEKPINCGGYNHPKRPLRRGSFRSSSFGGVGNRRGSAPIDTPMLPKSAHESLPKEWPKKQNNKKRMSSNNNKLFINSEDVLHDIRNFSHLHLMKIPSKVSSSNQLLAAKQSSHYNNGRRGSLPVEYISMPYIR